MAAAKKHSDEALEVARQLFEAEKRVAELRARFEALMNQGAAQPPTGPAGSAATGISVYDLGTVRLAPVKMSTTALRSMLEPPGLGDRVVTFLTANTGTLVPTGTIAQAVGVEPDKLPTLRTTLNRLVDRGSIESPLRGAFMVAPKEGHK